MIRPNRRNFLLASGMTALASTRAFGANERLRLGIIGAGGRMNSLIDAAERSGYPFDIVSVCDVYTPPMQRSMATFTKFCRTRTSTPS